MREFLAGKWIRSDVFDRVTRKLDTRISELERKVNVQRAMLSVLSKRRTEAGEDEDALKKAMEALATSQTKLGEALYQAEPDAGAPEDGETSESAEDEDIVDAEVVDDDTDTKK